MGWIRQLWWLPIACSACTETAPMLDPMGDPLALRVHHGQVSGTHNSYHERPDVVLHEAHDYHQPTLTAQLDDYGVRMLELDVRLREGVGLQVFHLPVIDEKSNCYLFGSCLEEIAAWSTSHPGHFPVAVWLELKWGELEEMIPDLEQLTPELERLDSAIWDAFDRDQLILPADVRGDAPSLRDAVADHGWPTLDWARGRVFFALINRGLERDAYLAPDPDLLERVVFVQPLSANDPLAAIAKDVRGPEVEDLTARGWLTYHNADTAEVPPEKRAALRAEGYADGVHGVAGDFPAGEPGVTRPILPPGGAPVACHPFTAPMGCTAEALESLPDRSSWRDRAR